jgi:cytidyltransferase-like protein
MCEIIEFPDGFDAHANKLLLPNASLNSFSDLERNQPETRVGIYQGTFDPPTITHCQMIERCVAILDALIVYPTNKNSKKSPAPLHHRIAMLFLAIPESIRAAVSIAVCPKQPPFPVFVAGCTASVGGTAFICQGTDKLLDLPWYKQATTPGARLRLLPHIVSRTAALSAAEIPSRVPYPPDKLLWVDAPPLVSSTSIRSAISTGDASFIATHVPERVSTYIHDNALYR